MTLDLSAEIRRILGEARRKRATDAWASSEIARLVYEKARDVYAQFPPSLDDCPACQTWSVRCEALTRQLEEHRSNQ